MKEPPECKGCIMTTCPRNRGLVELHWYSMTDEGYRGPAIDRLAAYEDSGLGPESVNQLAEKFRQLYRTFDECCPDDPVHFQGLLDKLGHLHQAEKDGRLVVLPCKVGDTVFVRIDDGAPCMARVQGISISSTGKDTILKFGGYPAVSAWGSDLGKTWFRSLQETEEALREEGVE